MSNTMRGFKIVGTICHILVGGLLLFACSGKAFGFAPPQVVESLTKFGLAGQIHLIGIGGMISAILILIPRTSPIGALAVSAYWGGAICIHMANHDSYVLPSIFLLFTWAGSVLRRPWVFFEVERSNPSDPCVGRAEALAHGA